MEKKSSRKKGLRSPSSDVPSLDGLKVSNEEVDESVAKSSSDDSDDEDDETSYATSSGDDETEAEVDDDNESSRGAVEKKIPAVDPLSRLLRNDSSLTEIKLDQQTLTNPLATDILAAVGKHSNLQKLSLRLEKVDPADYPTLVECLEHTASIQCLELVQPRIDRDAACAIGEAIAQNKTLKTLSLSTCGFYGSGLAVFFLGIQHSSFIQDLGIQGCGLGGFAADVVSASVPLMRLKSLRLDRVNIPLDGFRFLLDNIEKTPSLKQLHLSNDEIDSKAMKMLVPCLNSSSIKRLRLSSCGLTRSSVQVLCQGLAENKTLKYVDLSDNAFGDRAVTSLKDLLAKNQTIVELNVQGCQISEAKMKLLADALRYNNSFLKNVFSTEISLAIMDTSAGFMQNFSGSFG